MNIELFVRLALGYLIGLFVGYVLWGMELKARKTPTTKEEEQ